MPGQSPAVRDAPFRAPESPTPRTPARATTRPDEIFGRGTATPEQSRTVAGYRTRTGSDLAVTISKIEADFTKIHQLPLREAVKVWAYDELPRRRGRNVAGPMQNMIRGMEQLSENLRLQREDEGRQLRLLSRTDMVSFCNRGAFLAETGVFGAHHRVNVIRYVRKIVNRIRVMGLTGPGEVLEGLPADFALSVEDPDGTLVMVYDNSKNYRLGRRLPIAQATASVITAQRERVRERFPDTPTSKLKLLPSPVANPAGTKPIGSIGEAHRARVDDLPDIMMPVVVLVDGQLVTKMLPFDKSSSSPTPTGIPSRSVTRTATSPRMCSWI